MDDKKVIIAGDTIIDWVITDEKEYCCVGGAGNIVRGLMEFGHNVRYCTVYNPSVYPMDTFMELVPESVSDLDYTNVYIRNYTTNLFRRFRRNIRSKVFDVSQALAVICHEDSCVRKYNSYYADVRDTSVTGTSYILRMSSSNDFLAIMKKNRFTIGLVTHDSYVDIYDKDGEYKDTLYFERVESVDDIGAGDVFNVGFLNYYLGCQHPNDFNLETAIEEGVALAQWKVQRIGVFLDDEDIN